MWQARKWSSRRRTLAASGCRSARAARSCASASVNARSTRLTRLRYAGEAESAPTPSPTSSGVTRGSAASSPQTLTGNPWRAPASAVRAMSARTAGCSSRKRSETRSLPRSTASVNCVRSFVPIEKKSACRANASASRATAGTSTISPTGRSLRAGVPSAASSSATTWTARRSRRTSSMSDTIGSRICGSEPGTSAAARKRARSWGRSRSGLSSRIRIPRQPRKGFASRRAIGRTLSPPRSSRRNVTGCGPTARSASA